MSGGGGFCTAGSAGVIGSGFCTCGAGLRTAFMTGLGTALAVGCNGSILGSAFDGNRMAIMGCGLGAGAGLACASGAGAGAAGGGGRSTA